MRSQPPHIGADPARPSSRPTASFGPAKEAEQSFFAAPDAAPNVPDGPSVSPEPRRRRSRARGIFAKLLFATFFAGVTTLLVYALKKKFENASRIEPASALMPFKL